MFDDKVHMGILSDETFERHRHSVRNTKEKVEYGTCIL